MQIPSFELPRPREQINVRVLPPRRTEQARQQNRRAALRRTDRQRTIKYCWYFQAFYITLQAFSAYFPQDDNSIGDPSTTAFVSEFQQLFRLGLGISYEFSWRHKGTRAQGMAEFEFILYTSGLIELYTHALFLYIMTVSVYVYIYQSIEIQSVNLCIDRRSPSDRPSSW